ncbi:hypothetical protein ACTXT7_014348 [Hymenolepis weldensis]
MLVAVPMINKTIKITDEQKLVTLQIHLPNLPNNLIQQDKEVLYFIGKNYKTIAEMINGFDPNITPQLIRVLN